MRVRVLHLKAHRLVAVKVRPAVRSALEVDQAVHRRRQERDAFGACSRLGGLGVRAGAGRGVHLAVGEGVRVVHGRRGVARPVGGDEHRSGCVIVLAVVIRVPVALDDRVDVGLVVGGRGFGAGHVVGDQTQCRLVGVEHPGVRRAGVAERVEVGRRQAGRPVRARQLADQAVGAERDVAAADNVADRVVRGATQHAVRLRGRPGVLAGDRRVRHLDGTVDDACGPQLVRHSVG